MGDDVEFPVKVDLVSESDDLMEIRSMFHKHRKSKLKATNVKENMKWLTDKWEAKELVVFIAYSSGSLDEDEDEEEKQHLGFTILTYVESYAGRELVWTDHYVMPFISKKKKDEVYEETVKKVAESAGALGVAKISCYAEPEKLDLYKAANYTCKPMYAFKSESSV